MKRLQTISAATSRRRFLGQLPRLAGGVAAAMAGLLAGTTLIAAPARRVLCCHYVTPELIDYHVCRHNKCPERMGGRRHGDWLLGYYEVSDCSECGY